MKAHAENQTLTKVLVYFPHARDTKDSFRQHFWSGDSLPRARLRRALPPTVSAKDRVRASSIP